MTTENTPASPASSRGGLLGGIVRFLVWNPFFVVALLILAIGAGIRTAPFDWSWAGALRDPVPVDAIPDIGPNQQIVFTAWPGRSPRDVDDQITTPLTAALLGIPGVDEVRSSSMFGFSSIYVIFSEDRDFYWSRARILEQLNSLPAGTLPGGVSPTLGPDATALGQVFWYTLEGLDPDGNPTGGWDLDELRSIQDWQVRYALMTVEGVSEVASIGGFVKEYQVNIDPARLRHFDVTIRDIVRAIRSSNRDVGARSLEVNRVEYFVRGLGFIESLSDLEQAVITSRDEIPITLGDVADVQLGPAMRRGVLDKGGVEAVGGVVVARFGSNPLDVIKATKEKIAEIAPALPEKTLADGTRSRVSIVPFYDRTQLINETLGTLTTAIGQQILVTIVVVLLMIRHLPSSGLIAGLLPLAVLLTFVLMKQFGISANIVALSGIAIAIGTLVDMGIVICENIVRRLSGGRQTSPAGRREEIVRATVEVGPAVLVAVATTVVGFLPVFALEHAEGKLFRPLAFTKTFALVGSIAVALLIIPSMAGLLFGHRDHPARWRRLGGSAAWLALAIAAFSLGYALVGWALLAAALAAAPKPGGTSRLGKTLTWLPVLLLAAVVATLLTLDWLPLGVLSGLTANLVFVIGLIAGLLGFFFLFYRAYESILRWCLDHRALFLSLPALLILAGLMTWFGFGTLFGWLPESVRQSPPARAAAEVFPGLGQEFMPSLDEGEFLFMPTTMPHSSIQAAHDILRRQDLAIQAIPEVEHAVGKIGRVDSPLDPAPISMMETVIRYRPEFILDDRGERTRYRYRPGETGLMRDASGQPLPAPDGEPYTVRGIYARTDHDALIPDEQGRPFRQWRRPLDPALNPGREAWPGIQSPDDIWDEIAAAGDVAGSTSAPKLQPIETRLVMLQTGMKAPIGIKIRGPSLQAIEEAGIAMEEALRQVPDIRAETVAADRLVAKPYLEIDLDRQSIARYGLSVSDVQDVIETAIGGKRITSTVEGLARYPVRARYKRELRHHPDTIGRMLVTTPQGAYVPLERLAEIRYRRGPMAIKREGTFLIGTLTFGAREGVAEVDAVETARRALESGRESGRLDLPEGISYTFAGSYENQVRAERKMAVLIPVSLLIILMILHFMFRSLKVSAVVFSGVFLAWAGGFLMLWAYGQPWFLDISIAGQSLREIFAIGPVNLSTAVWVGFLALFGIATDNGVLIAAILRDEFERNPAHSRRDIVENVVRGSKKRVRPALMTTATTLLALLPVLSSTGRGADIMVPMAIPSFGGMLFALLTLFLVPVLYAGLHRPRRE